MPRDTGKPVEQSPVRHRHRLRLGLQQPRLILPGFQPTLRRQSWQGASRLIGDYIRDEQVAQSGQVQVVSPQRPHSSKRELLMLGLAHAELARTDGQAVLAG